MLMARLTELMVANNGAAAAEVRAPTHAEINVMSALETMQHAYRHFAHLGNWKEAATWAREAAPYETARLAPIAPAADEDEQNCRRN